MARLRTIRKHYQFLQQCKDARFSIMYGGSSGGKSWSLAAFLIQKIYREPGVGLFVFRKTLPAVKKSCYKLIKHYLHEWQWPYRENKSEMVITLPNRSFIQFAGLDDNSKLKSAEGMNYAWLEEATEFTEHDFLQIHIRCRAKNFYGLNQIYLSFNPVDQSANAWLKAMTDQRPEGSVLKAKARILHCTHTDNPFLSEFEHNAIEALADADEEYDKIYRKGEWAVPSHIIYNHWGIVHEIPTVEQYGYGLDFGYIHPTALVWCGIKEIDLYLREMIYETHLTNQMLIDRLRQLDINPCDTIMADSAEPAYIDEIADAGYNVLPVNKVSGQGDKSFVRTGIDRMKRFRIHIDAGSNNIKEEIASYKWKVNKDGIVLPEPVKFKDHAMDAARYFVGSMEEEAQVIVLGEYQY